MADRSVTVRLTASVADFTRNMATAGKSAEDMGRRTQQANKGASSALGQAGAAAKDAAGKVGQATDAAVANAKAAGLAQDAQGRWRDSNGRFVNSQELVARGLAKTSTEAQKSSTALSRMAESARTNEQQWRTVGTTLTGVGVAAAAGLGVAAKAAMDWESAWAGVNKTVDGSPEQMAALEQELRGLATTLPATHQEIAATAEAAGQLGVSRGDIASFTKTAIDMGESTNLSAEEAATGLAQLGNVMGVLPTEANRAGSALVALGNDGASTEADILSMSLRLAGAGKTIGATEADVLGLASGLANVGIEAEAGGSALSRVMVDIAQSVETGNSKLGTFAEVAGLSSEEFATAFRDDAAGAVVTFVEGLGRMQASGESVFGTLDELELSEIRVRDALLRTAGAGDMLRESLDLGSTAWEANAALAEEAGKRYETSESQIAMARNQLNDAAIDLGAQVLPMLVQVADGVGTLAQGFADLPTPVQEAIAGLGGLTAAAGLTAGGFVLLFPRVIETIDAVKKIAPAGGTASRAIGGLTKGLGALAIAFAAAQAASMIMGSGLDDVSGIEAYTKAILDLDSATPKAAVNFDELFVIDGQGTANIEGLGQALRTLDAGVVAKFVDSGASMFGIFDTQVGLAEAAMAQFDAALTALVQSGATEQAAAGAEYLRDALVEQGQSADKAKELLPQYGEALLAIENQQLLAGESADATADAVGRLPGATAAAGEAALALPTSFQALVESMGLSEEGAEKLREDVMALGETMLGFVDPLGAYTGLLEQKTEADRLQAEATAAATDSQEDSWEDFVGVVGVSTGEYLTELERQQEAQQDWQENMLRLAGRVSQGTLDELARMGPEGAPLVADLVNASDSELQRLDDVFAGNAEDAVFAWGEKLRVAQPVLAEIARVAGQGAADAAAAALANGTATIADIASQYGVALAGGVNPVLVSLGKRRISGRGGSQGGLLEADGGVVDYYASGGLRENHTAQIAPAGAWRTWAEPETGGEAYIPLAASKRPRSLDIWAETGRRLGAFEDDIVSASMAFADGGFAGERLLRSGSTYKDILQSRRLQMSGVGPLRAATDMWDGLIADLDVGLGTGRTPAYLKDMDLPGGTLGRAFQEDGGGNLDLDAIRRGGYSAKTVAAHEIGHFLGLGHGAGGRSIMAPFENSPNKSDKPTSTDIANLRDLYPVLKQAAEKYGLVGAKIPKPPSMAPFQSPFAPLGDAVMERAYAKVMDWVEDNSFPEGPGAAGGPPPGGGSSLVSIGKWLQSKGARVSGHPSFGGVTPGAHSPTSLHYKNRAIDVNYGGGGANAAENRFVRGVLPQLRQMATFRQLYYREIGGRSDHDDHLHLGLANGGILDQGKGSVVNPHVRDAGGPLLPGMTLNGTGGPEQTVLTSHLVDVVSRAATKAGPQGPMHIVGTLDLGDGLKGVIRGEATVVADQRIAAYDKAEMLSATYNPGAGL